MEEMRSMQSMKEFLAGVAWYDEEVYCTEIKDKLQHLIIGEDLYVDTVKDIAPYSNLKSLLLNSKHDDVV